MKGLRCSGSIACKPLKAVSTGIGDFPPTPNRSEPPTKGGKSRAGGEKRRGAGNDGGNVLAAPARSQMIACRTFAETHSLTTTVPMMMSRITVTRVQARSMMEALS